MSSPPAAKEPRSMFGKFIIFVLSSIALVLLIAPDWSPSGPRLVYNASDSAPRGFYIVDAARHLHVGDLVVARMPLDAAALAAQRQYLPKDVPLIKTVAAIAPQLVCVRADGVRIDGKWVAPVLDADARGRRLTAWPACRQLADTELFIMSAHPASFDSRYFGPVDATRVLGRARPLAEGGA
jgi:conjugative transfer signal peptidase TraF